MKQEVYNYTAAPVSLGRFVVPVGGPYVLPDGYLGSSYLYCVTSEGLADMTLEGPYYVSGSDPVATFRAGMMDSIPVITVLIALYMVRLLRRAPSGS